MIYNNRNVLITILRSMVYVHWNSMVRRTLKLRSGLDMEFP